MAATHAHAPIADARAIRSAGAGTVTYTAAVPDAHANANEGLSGVSIR